MARPNWSLYLRFLPGFLCILLACESLFTSEPAPPPLPEQKKRIEEQIRNDQPSFLVRASVDRLSRSYREGDTLKISVVSEQDAYLYVLYQPAKGTPYKIFPTRFQSKNFVKAKQVVQIPAEDDLFRWVIGPPFGKETIKVIASKTPIKEFSAAELNKRRFTPVSDDVLKGVELELGEEPTKDWAESDVEIYTYPRSESETPTVARRYGVFFGVSQYKYNEEYKLAAKGKHSLNLPTAGPDARVLGKVFAETGRLNDLRVYVDEGATKKQLEQSITEWLPEVSRPGDTVFIFFSGHGVKIMDDNGDEADGLDEALTPHDTIDVGILVQLAQQVKEGKNVDPRFKHLVEVAFQAGTDPRKQYAALLRETGVSDDLFTRWLQRLDGRKVVVLLHTCHSGGFATIEKSLTPQKAMFQFDFLDNEASRLKDIGQTGQALFASSMSTQYSATLRGVNGMTLSVMPHFLAWSLLQPGGPLTLDRGFELCRKEMRSFYETLNPKIKEHLNQLVEKAGNGAETGFVQEPYLINNIPGDVYLRP